MDPGFLGQQVGWNQEVLLHLRRNAANRLHADVFEGDWGAKEHRFLPHEGRVGEVLPIRFRHSRPDPAHIAVASASTPTIAAKADLRAAHPRARRACELGRHQRRLRERRH